MAAAWADPSRIRTTAEASRTTLEALAVGISAGAILANQLLGGGFKTVHRLLTGQGLEIGQGLATTLARIATTGLLQIAQSLLAQAAVMLPGALLKQLMQRIWHVANLQRGHCFALHARCMHFACGSSCLGLTPITPGELLDEELLQPLGVSQYRLAKAIDVPASRISEIVAGRRSISPELAEEIARIEPLVVG